MIYFVQADGVGHIKIGFTDGEDAVKRLAELQTGSPVLLRLLGTIPGDLATEKDFHRQFAAARVHGEWFQPVPELLQAIGQVKLPACGPVGVALRSVQVKILTVGRKSLTRQMIQQLIPTSIIDWNRAIEASKEDPEAFSRMPSSSFEEGSPWGWLEWGDMGYVPEQGNANRLLIYECDGSLFREPIWKAMPLWIRKRHDLDWNLLERFWRACQRRWVTADQQLFFGM